MLDTMKAIVKRMDFCVLATVCQDQPHCSLMAYAADADCREIYMVTYRNTRKYRNLKQNPSVSLLVDTRVNPAAGGPAQAVTLGGRISEIDTAGRRAEARTRLLARHPELESFMAADETALLAVQVDSWLLMDGLTQAYYGPAAGGDGQAI